MRCRLPARGLTERTSPMSVTMPVNMALSPHEAFYRIGAELFAAAQCETAGQRVERHSVQRVDSGCADGLLTTQHDRFVNKIGIDETGRDRRSTFDHQPSDALVGQRL